MTEQERERRKKLSLLLEKDKSYPYQIESVDCSHSINQILENSDSLISSVVSCIGRIVSIRQSFLTLRYDLSDIQLYVCSKNPEISSYFQNFVDTGDFLLVKGECFRTNKGVLTIRVSEAQIISKCLNYFPSQYYGINSDELKYKDRVGKALSSPEFLNTFYQRSRIISNIRSYLNSLGYLELETPILESVYGGANAVPFKTFCQSLKQDFFLRIATEISLKKLIISGFPKVYEIGKVFRNEGIDATHNPEFTSLEIYTVNIKFEDLVRLSEDIIQTIASNLNIQSVIFGGHEIDLSSNFRRVSMASLVKEKTGVDFYNSEVSLAEALSLAEKFDIPLRPFEKTVGNIFHKIFDKLIVPELVQPTFVCGFHKDVSPLSKTDPNNPNFTSRYELYIGGLEFANGFSELNDPDDQLSRFKAQLEERKLGNEEAFEFDENFIFSLKYGMPPTGGLGIGIDRLVMLLTTSKSIKDVLFFPIVSNK